MRDVSFCPCLQSLNSHSTQLANQLSVWCLTGFNMFWDLFNTHISLLPVVRPLPHSSQCNFSFCWLLIRTWITMVTVKAPNLQSISVSHMHLQIFVGSKSMVRHCEAFHLNINTWMNASGQYLLFDDRQLQTSSNRNTNPIKFKVASNRSLFEWLFKVGFQHI